MASVNERRRYNVKSPLIGYTDTQKQNRESSTGLSWSNVAIWKITYD